MTGLVSRRYGVRPGGPAADAAQHLGIPHQATKNALTVVHQQLPGHARHAFDTAVDALADYLNTAIHLTDFGNRRHTLSGWSLSYEDWDELAGDLREKHSQRRGRWPSSPYIDWDDSKRLLSSIWIWVRITHGEHIFAPAIRPDLNDRRPGGTTIKYINSRWPQISAEHPRGHYAELRERLDTYADQLTEEID